ncbi:MAG: anthranilate synthase component I [Rhodospirillales bacterium]|nr:anthranilate synthase component I [Rhodospirillales bacterium]
MKVQPDFSVFAGLYARGKAQVIWTHLVADLETPVSAFLKLGAGRPNSFLLESVEGGNIRGRYSFIGLAPDLVWRCFGDRAEVNRDPDAMSGIHSHDAPSRFAPCPGGAIASLRALERESRIDLPPGLPPMAAGLVGYLAYDIVRLVEKLPASKPDVLGVPDSIFVRPTIMVVFDRLSEQASVIAPVRPAPGVDAKAAWDRAIRRIESVAADLGRALPPAASEARPDTLAASGTAALPGANMTRDQFHGMVKKAVEYIRAGDAFQIVPSQRFAVPFKSSPFAFYRALRRLNPSPFLFFLDFGGFAVAGSSPEILVRLRAGKVTIRPLAGTRRRGATPDEDRALAAELLADPKERAEHLMLLDLGRNDVGRVAKVGTVKVTEQFTVEYYSHVMHIASNVEGEIDPKFDAIDALLAGFPAGTVSGAPKIRAMEIIEELEPERRGVYAGCIGYFGANGEMDTCIALRTAVIKDNVVYIQAGGGVVADSTPEGEYQESCNKARALIRAAEEAQNFA